MRQVPQVRPPPVLRSGCWEGPRGIQSSLARFVDVEPQTVNKWARMQTCPAPERWESIERFFHLDPGHLTRVAGLGEVRVDVEDLTSAPVAALIHKTDGSVTCLARSRYLHAIGASAESADFDGLRDDPEAYPAFLESVLTHLARRIANIEQQLGLAVAAEGGTVDDVIEGTKPARRRNRPSPPASDE